MNDRLQTQLFGPYLSSFSAYNYCYELSNEPKFVLKLLDFRFGPYSRTDSWRQSSHAESPKQSDHNKDRWQKVAYGQSLDAHQVDRYRYNE